jgi:nucleotide-binding universal stress UspA family protein
MTASSATVADSTRRPDGWSALPEHLVVGVDGSENSLRALDLAATVARRNGSAVTVAFVRHPPVFAGTVAVDWSAIFAPVEGETAEAASERLAGLRWRLLDTDGAPALELERVARQVGADLLVVGGGRGGPVHRLFSGSVGGHAATHAPAPVLVVR